MAGKETVVGLKKALEASTQLIDRLESDLEARSSALEASVAAAAGVPYSKSSSSSSNAARSAAAGAGGDAGNTLDLAALLGVEGGAESGVGANNNNKLGVKKNGDGTAITTASGTNTGASNTGNHQINMQMINILQSHRDQYKDKLTRVSAQARYTLLFPSNAFFFCSVPTSRFCFLYIDIEMSFFSISQISITNIRKSF